MIKYNINEEKQTVAAFFEGKKNFDGHTGDTKDYWIQCIVGKARKIFAKREFIDYHAVIDTAFNTALRAVNQLDNVAGIATSNDGKFDVEKFKEISKARLLRKYYRVEREVMHKIRLMIDNNFNSIDIFKYYDAIDSRTESYDKKIKELRCN